MGSTKLGGFSVLFVCLVGWIFFFYLAIRIELCLIVLLGEHQEGVEEEVGSFKQYDLHIYNDDKPFEICSELSMTVMLTGCQEHFVIDTGGLTYFVPLFLLQLSSL